LEPVDYILYKNFIKGQRATNLVNDMGEDKIIMAYATEGGTTEEYANAIASVLIELDETKRDLLYVVNGKLSPDIGPVSFTRKGR